MSKNITVEGVWCTPETRHEAYGIKTRRFNKPLSEFRQALENDAFNQTQFLFTKLYLTDEKGDVVVENGSEKYVELGEYKVIKKIKETGELVEFLCADPEQYDDLVKRRDLDTEEEVEFVVLNKAEKAEIEVNLSLLVE